MKRYILIAARVATIGLMIGAGVGTARAEEITVPAVPGNLNVDEGNEVFLVGHGVGTQNYVCTTSTTSVSGFAFSLFTPEATLFSGEGRQLITHFFSPNGDPTVKPPEAGTIRATWEDSRDSSRVWAAILEQSTDEQFVQKDAVAWLKLQTVGTDVGPHGEGRLTKVTFVQRLNTVGGLAPKEGCSTFEELGRKAFVPYSADYFFYKESHKH